MLSAQADALLERIDRAVPQGRQAALELLLRLTRIDTEGRHTRQRITREEAVAGNGKDAVGERVVQLLSGDGRPTGGECFLARGGGVCRVARIYRDTQHGQTASTTCFFTRLAPPPAGLSGLSANGVS